MADDGNPKIQAHGAAAAVASTCKLENRLMVTAMLLYLAVFTEGCLTSDDPASQELLQIPPWPPFRRMQCPPKTSPDNLVGKRGQMQTRVRAGPTSVVAASSAAMFSSAPCACNTRMTILDLGSSSFPRYLPSVDCHVTTAQCRREGRCRQRRYKIRVLRRRQLSLGEDGIEEERFAGVEDDSLPESLRSSWRYEERTINAACECIP